jgi:hypothetical protein
MRTNIGQTVEYVASASQADPDRSIVRLKPDTTYSAVVTISDRMDKCIDSKR